MSDKVDRLNRLICIQYVLALFGGCVKGGVEKWLQLMLCGRTICQVQFFYYAQTWKSNRSKN